MTAEHAAISNQQSVISKTTRQPAHSPSLLVSFLQQGVKRRPGGGPGRGARGERRGTRDRHLDIDAAERWGAERRHDVVFDEAASHVACQPHTRTNIILLPPAIWLLAVRRLILAETRKHQQVEQPLGFKAKVKFLCLVCMQVSCARGETVSRQARTAACQSRRQQQA